MEIINGKDIDQYLDYDEVSNLLIDNCDVAVDIAKQYFADDRDQETAKYLPWKKTHSTFNFRKGELTIWAGHTKSFKSMLTGYVLLWLVAQEEKVCIASLEMPVNVTASRMMGQYLGKTDDLVKNDMGKFQWFQPHHLWYYTHRGTVDPRRLEAMVHYCVKVKGITHIMIDSLMMVSVPGEELRGTKDFVVKLSSLAKGYNIHIHLVTHMRKPSKQHEVITMFDISGTSNIPNIADNIFLISKPEGDDKPDLFLNLCAQRLGGTAIWGLWHNDAFQFLAAERSARYDPDDIKHLRFIE